MASHVSGRANLQEAGSCFLDSESVATTIFESQSKRKRDQDTDVLHSLKDRENLQQILGRKIDSAVRREMVAQQKLHETETEVEARHWGKRDIFCLFKRSIIQDFESQRFQLHQASRWAEQGQRDNISLCVELRIRLFQEDHARDCPEFEELRSICCEDTDRARQARNDELSTHQERDPTTVSQSIDSSTFGNYRMK